MGAKGTEHDWMRVRLAVRPAWSPLGPGSVRPWNVGDRRWYLRALGLHQPLPRWLQRGCVDGDDSAELWE